MRNYRSGPSPILVVLLFPKSLVITAKAAGGDFTRLVTCFSVYSHLRSEVLDDLYRIFFESDIFFPQQSYQGFRLARLSTTCVNGVELGLRKGLGCRASCFDPELNHQGMTCPKPSTLQPLGVFPEGTLNPQP